MERMTCNLSIRDTNTTFATLDHAKHQEHCKPRKGSGQKVQRPLVGQQGSRLMMLDLPRLAVL